MATVHDHFEGTANCVECKGKCQLVGDDLNLTRLVRWTLEFSEAVHKGWMWGFTEDTLRDILGASRLEHFRYRAKDTVVVRHG